MVASESREEEKKLQEIHSKLAQSSNYGMEEIADYDEPIERLRKRYEWIELRYGDSVKNRNKAESMRPDLIKKLDDLYSKADEMFVRFFVVQMWDMEELNSRWDEYEAKVLYPMSKVLSEMSFL